MRHLGTSPETLSLILQFICTYNTSGHKSKHKAGTKARIETKCVPPPPPPPLRMVRAARSWFTFFVLSHNCCLFRLSDSHTGSTGYSPDHNTHEPAVLGRPLRVLQGLDVSHSQWPIQAIPYMHRLPFFHALILGISPPDLLGPIIQL